jgi:hypothetical protein
MYVYCIYTCIIWLKYDFMHIFMHNLSLYFETTVQMPEVELGGKYRYMRANTDIWGQIRIFEGIKPDSEAGGLIWVESWYQGRYGKFHVIIHIIFEITAQIPEVKFRGKYGYLRVNTDVCPNFPLGQIRLIPGPIWKMSCNNLLILTGSLTKTNRENINVKYNILNWRLAHHQNITWWNEY